MRSRVMSALRLQASVHAPVVLREASTRDVDAPHILSGCRLYEPSTGLSDRVVARYIVLAAVGNRWLAFGVFGVFVEIGQDDFI